MDISKYTELTGITVSPSKEALYKATIRRTKNQIESLLGFSLKPQYLYTEKGKVQFEGYLPIENFTTLLDPDGEEGTYRLFPFNESDKYFHVDPFKNIYKVKLVVPQNDGEFITVTQLDNIVAQYGRDGIGKYIERHYEWFTWAWYYTWRLQYAYGTPNGLQLAIDADWMDCYPDDILYLWADMVTYYANPDNQVGNRIKSESVDGHSWSFSDSTSPEAELGNKQLLARYAGPFGTATRNPVR